MTDLRRDGLTLPDDGPAHANTHAEAARARKKAEAEAIGVTDAYIHRFVDLFYDRVRADAVLGPIFDARIADWPAHLAKLKQFWASVLHNAGTYSGRPMPAHVAIPDIDQTHFNRWLALFRRTLVDVDDSADGTAAAAVDERARMIAASLMHGIAIHRDGQLR